MRKSTFFVFTGYIWTKTLLGLTFSPFTSIQGVMRRPILFPVIFSPAIGIMILFVLGRIAALFVAPHGAHREMVAVFLSTTLISILMWQGLLVYLFISFLIASWRR